MRNLKDIFSPKDGVTGGLLINLPDSSFNVHTNVELLKLDNNGNLLEIIDLGENVITNTGRSNMAHILAGDDFSNRIVTTMKFGDGGHNPSDPTQALATSPTDTGLYGSTVISKSVSYEFPDGPSASKIAFLATIETNEGNGSGSQPYSEVGLFDLSGRMLTHKCFGLITKSDAFGLAIRYSILF